MDLSKLKHSKVENLNQDSINSIDLLESNKNLVFTCSDEEIVVYNTETRDRSKLFSSESGNDEIGSIKSTSLNQTEILLATNDKFIHVFDVNTLKQLGKHKFAKDSINCLEVNKQASLLAIGDDTGEIRLIDLRLNPANTESSLTLKKTLAKHENICFTLKFNPLNENELFSGSFDCSIIKWDTRFVKNNKSAMKKQFQVGELMGKLDSQKEKEKNLISSMTPCFVHSLHFYEKQNANVLCCGIENGLCLALNPISLEYLSCKQLQPFNCALTQLESFESLSRLRKEIDQDRKVFMAGGNGKSIEFAFVSNKNEIVKEPEAAIAHGDKINCIKYREEKLYVADTSNDLIIYDFNDVLFK